MIKKQILNDSLENQKQEVKELWRTLFACPKVVFQKENTDDRPVILGKEAYLP